MIVVAMRPRRLALAGALLLSSGLEPARAAADHPQIVVLVRHAERSDAPAGDVTLSEAGRSRADELLAALAEARIDTIVTTQFRRTRDTAAPLARALALTPTVVEAGRDTAAHVRAVVAAIRAAGSAVLVVGHSNTVPAIIGALGGPAMEELCEFEYSHLFTLALTPGQPARLVHGHYGAPDPPTASGCRRGTKP